MQSIASLPCKIVLGDLIQTSFQEIMLSSGVFRRERRAVFILGAMWIALVRGWRWDCVVGGMETRFQRRKAHSRTAKCEAFHIAPRLFFMFLFLIPFTIRQQYIIYAPRNYPLSPCNSSNSVFFRTNKKTATTFRGNSRCYFLCFLIILYNEELIY